MTMLAKQLLDNFRVQFDQLEKEQLGRIDQAAAMVADSISAAAPGMS